ncbi:MAG: methionine synthase [Bacilli bacterium]|nr:methionine synthase [Bacilli bacterium]
MPETTLEKQLKQKILILDGAMGTMIQQADLNMQDYGGELYEGCPEMLNVTRPDVIRGIYEAYMEAGSDIIETNTFGGTPLVLAEFGLQHRADELNSAAARLAVDAARKWSTPDWPRFVAGSMGPTTKTLSVTGGITFDELVQHYFVQALALLRGGVDALLLETSQDTLNVKAGGIGIRLAFEQFGRKVPVMISGTIEPMGTTLAGQSIESFYLSLEHLKPVAIGLNCATGPEFMRDHIRTLSGLAQCAVSCYPNAGLPDENGHYHESPVSLAKKMAGFAEHGWVNIVGGCCGTTPEHIRLLAETMKQFKPRTPASEHQPAVSGIEPLFVEPDNRPLLVGERTNVIGSRKFKRLIAEGKYEEASEVARDQVKGGAHVIDICLEDPDRNEAEDMERFLKFVVNKVKVPLVIDSTNANTIDLALKYSQGKAIINSINMEDGEERFQQVVPLIHRYGAASVVGTIDEQGMAVTRQRKLEVAKRSFDILVGKYGLNPKDIIFDPLVFPCGTGDEQYIGSAMETVEGIRLIKEALPDCQTILGISNVSFGLPAAGREILNSVFLFHCTKAGLDYAIVNSQKLERYASIPDEERRLAEAILFQTSDESVSAFANFYRDKKVVKKETISNLSLEERLSAYVVEGTKEGLIPDLQAALDKYAPMEIINGPLMTGMEEVGRLFNNNELIVAEVLQSAEVMKASVTYLESFMEKSETTVKGKILLATVKGDVHDIGKNLVEIILSNNGYQIVNLGIKVPPEELISAFRREKPDAIGLSGLLVKSAQQMVITAQDLRVAGIDVPLMVGGAALTRKFTRTRIAPEYEGLVLYAKDAMDGLDLANRLTNPQLREQLIAELRESIGSNVMEAGASSTAVQPTVDDRPKRSSVRQDTPVFVPPDLTQHILRNYPLSYLYPYVNPLMLFGRHLGLRGNVEEMLAEGNEKALELKAVVDELLAQAITDKTIVANGLYQFFPAQSSGNDVLIYDPNDHSRVLETFSFPRQDKPPYLCLADYLRPVDGGVMDYVGFLSVTAGKGIRDLAGEWKDRGDYLRSHAVQAMALELAEAFAERIHQMMRDVWGFPDSADITMKQIWGARYQGCRFSYGYPACPDLAYQEQLFRLIHPEDIGVQLTEGFMMDPEASVTAMVFAHPEARYFGSD